MKYASHPKPFLVIRSEDDRKGGRSCRKHTHSPDRDENEFTDAFMRKENNEKDHTNEYLTREKSISNNNNNTSYNNKELLTKQNNNFFIQTNHNNIQNNTYNNTKKNEELKLNIKNLHKTVTCQTNKKQFDIKFITPRSKPQINSQFHSIKRKEQLEKEKYNNNKKKEYVNDDDAKLLSEELFLSMRGSGRYATATKQQNKTSESNEEEEQQNLKKSIIDKPKPLHVSVNFIEHFNSTKHSEETINNNNKENREKSLLAAYKIKSLVLEKNPREELWERTRRYVRKEMDWGSENNNKKSTIYNSDSGRPQSERVGDNFLLRLGVDESRVIITTESGDNKRENRRDYCMAELASSRERDHTSFVTPRKIGNINMTNSSNNNNKGKSTNPLSLLPRFINNDDKINMRNKTTKNKNNDLLEPWVKNSNQEDIVLFGDDIIEQSVDMIDTQPYQYTLDNLPSTTPLIADSLNYSKTGRHSYRKIYSRKEKASNKLIIKDTINSGKWT